MDGVDLGIQGRGTLFPTLPGATGILVGRELAQPSLACLSEAGQGCVFNLIKIRMDSLVYRAALSD